MNWQPIETAPKDGTLILVFTPEDEDKFAVVSWMSRNWFPAFGYTCYTCGSGLADPDPTHWMPLPPPPTE